MKAIPRNLHSYDFDVSVERASLEFDMLRPLRARIGGTIFEKGIPVKAEVTAVIDRVEPDPNAKDGA